MRSSTDMKGLSIFGLLFVVSTSRSDQFYTVSAPIAAQPLYYSSIPGDEGIDYPILATIPNTQFRCPDLPGYYADMETECQMFHICQTDGRHDRLLCPNGTVFNQPLFVCDWWFHVDCSLSSSFYDLNRNIYSGKPYFQTNSLNKERTNIPYLEEGQSVQLIGRPREFQQEGRPEISLYFRSSEFIDLTPEVAVPESSEKGGYKDLSDSRMSSFEELIFQKGPFYNKVFRPQEFLPKYADNKNNGEQQGAYEGLTEREYTPSKPIVQTELEHTTPTDNSETSPMRTHSEMQAYHNHNRQQQYANADLTTSGKPSSQPPNLKKETQTLGSNNYQESGVEQNHSELARDNNEHSRDLGNSVVYHASTSKWNKPGKSKTIAIVPKFEDESHNVTDNVESEKEEFGRKLRPFYLLETTGKRETTEPTRFESTTIIVPTTYNPTSYFRVKFNSTEKKERIEKEFKKFEIKKSESEEREEAEIKKNWDSVRIQTQIPSIKELSKSNSSLDRLNSSQAQSQTEGSLPADEELSVIEVSVESVTLKSRTKEAVIIPKDEQELLLLTGIGTESSDKPVPFLDYKALDPSIITFSQPEHNENPLPKSQKLLVTTGSASTTTLNSDIDRNDTTQGPNYKESSLQRQSKDSVAIKETAAGQVSTPSGISSNQYSSTALDEKSGQAGTDMSNVYAASEPTAMKTLFIANEETGPVQEISEEELKSEQAELVKETTALQNEATTEISTLRQISSEMIEENAAVYDLTTAYDQLDPNLELETLSTSDRMGKSIGNIPASTEKQDIPTTEETITEGASVRNRFTPLMNDATEIEEVMQDNIEVITNETDEPTSATESGNSVSLLPETILADANVVPRNLERKVEDDVTFEASGFEPADTETTATLTETTEEAKTNSQQLFETDIVDDVSLRGLQADDTDLLENEGLLDTTTDVPTTLDENLATEVDGLLIPITPGPNADNVVEDTTAFDGIELFTVSMADNTDTMVTSDAALGKRSAAALFINHTKQTIFKKKSKITKKDGTTTRVMLIDEDDNIPSTFQTSTEVQGVAKTVKESYIEVQKSKNRKNMSNTKRKLPIFLGSLRRKQNHVNDSSVEMQSLSSEGLFIQSVSEISHDIDSAKTTTSSLSPKKYVRKKGKVYHI